MYKAVRILEEWSSLEDRMREIALWLAGIVKREGRQIKAVTAEYMLSRTGTDMENLEREMEKLFSYTLGRNEITVADIDAICTTQITNKIFDMIEAVATRQQRKALDYYYDLLALKEPPMRILYLLARQFRLLLQVKDLMNQGADKSTIAKKSGTSSICGRKIHATEQKLYNERTKRYHGRSGRYRRSCKDRTAQ